MEPRLGDPSDPSYLISKSVHIRARCGGYNDLYILLGLGLTSDEGRHEPS
jgi:hypothetical protein